MVRIESCLSAILVCIIVCNVPVSEGRSLRRHHHSHEREPVQRNLPQLEDALEYRSFYERMVDRHGYASDLVEHSLKFTNVKGRLENVPSPHRFRHQYDSRNGLKGRDSFPQRRKEMHRYNEELDQLSARRKRHNNHDNAVHYRKSTDQDKEDILLSRQNDQELQSGEDSGLHVYELEVKKAQNSSICNYTVMSIPDDRGNRVPKDLEHVMCNHAGSNCKGTGYCCIQTYKNIEVSYGDNDKEIMKLYVGCVCAHQVYNDLRITESPLPIHD